MMRVLSPTRACSRQAPPVSPPGYPLHRPGRPHAGTDGRTRSATERRRAPSAGAAFGSSPSPLAWALPIRGVLNTAAGVAGVHWPGRSGAGSSDGRAYYPLGDLVELSARKHTPSGYAVHRFHTDELQAHGGT